MRERLLLCVNDVPPKTALFASYCRNPFPHHEHARKAIWVDSSHLVASMSDVARAALERAAARASRRVELENARICMERHLGYDLQDDQFHWTSVLSMPQIRTW